MSNSQQECIQDENFLGAIKTEKCTVFVYKS